MDETRRIGARATERVLAEHRGTLQAVIDAAETVASTWDAPETTERSAVSEPLEQELRERDLLDLLLSLLSDAVDAAGFDLQARPVAGPPYLAITGTGPVLRATVEGGRIVVRLAVFEVERGPRRYRLAGSDPVGVLDIEFRSRAD